MIGKNDINFAVSEDIVDRDGQTIRVQECSHISEDSPHCEIFISNIPDDLILVNDEIGKKFVGVDLTLSAAKRLLEDLQSIVGHLENHI